MEAIMGDRMEVDRGWDVHGTHGPWILACHSHAFHPRVTELVFRTGRIKKSAHGKIAPEQASAPRLS